MAAKSRGRAGRGSGAGVGSAATGVAGRAGAGAGAAGLRAAGAGDVADVFWSGFASVVFAAAVLLPLGSLAIVGLFVPARQYLVKSANLLAEGGSLYAQPRDVGE